MLGVVCLRHERFPLNENSLSENSILIYIITHYEHYYRYETTWIWLHILWTYIVYVKWNEISFIIFNRFDALCKYTAAVHKLIHCTQTCVLLHRYRKKTLNSLDETYIGIKYTIKGSSVSSTPSNLLYENNIHKQKCPYSKIEPEVCTSWVKGKHDSFKVG